MDTSITVDDIDTFKAEVWKVIERTIEIGHPVKVSASYGNDDLLGCIMFSRWNGKTIMESVHTSFKIGDYIFPYCEGIEQRLLDCGLLVDDMNVVGATHIVTIAHGVWADTKLPVQNKYRFKGDDTDALLATIKFGGRLEKI